MKAEIVRTFLSSLLISIAALVAAIIVNILSSSDPFPHKLQSLTLLFFFIFVASASIETLIKNHRDFKPLRKIFDPIARFEGRFIQQVEGIEDRPTAISEISYDSKRNAWAYCGYAYSKEGEPAARWTCWSVRRDSVSRTWIFIGSAVLIIKDDKSDDYIAKEPSTTLLCLLRDDPGHGRDLIWCIGLDFFIDKPLEYNGFKTKLQRIDKMSLASFLKERKKPIRRWTYKEIISAQKALFR